MLVVVAAMRNELHIGQHTVVAVVVAVTALQRVDRELCESVEVALQLREAPHFRLFFFFIPS